MRLAAIGLLMLLTACASFPRGAGLQREVLANQTEDAKGAAPAVQNFAIAPVTRDNLDVYAGWPAVGERALPWPGRGAGTSDRYIRPGDLLTVRLWVNEENSLLTSPGERQAALAPMQVDPQGNVFLPYVGSIDLSGKTVEAARAEVQQAYTAVSPSAQVQLELQEGRQSSASLVSGVVKPGLYPLTGRDVSILELLALGGGAAAGLGNPQVRLQRAGTLYGLSMQRLLEEPAANTLIRGGDKIYVEADRRHFLALGAAGRRAQLPFPQDRLTALEAVSLIGGLLDARADARSILILRAYPEKAVRADGRGPSHVRTIFTLDLTTADGLFSAGAFRIMPGDLVYATESPLGSTATLINLIAAVFGVANTASAVVDRTSE
jgi:polysaccharide export outer membrane protein